MRRVGRWVGGAWLVGIVALGGCAAPELAVPEVVWEGGRVPSGPFEDDPWVVGLREADVALAVAANANDYRGEALAATVAGSTSWLVAHQRASRAVDDVWSFAPGPTPMVVLDVTELQDGRRGVVRTCEAVNWSVAEDRPEPPTELRGEVYENELIRSASGAPRFSGATPKGESCDLSGAAVGVFDPAPDPSATYTRDDVRLPPRR